jgi:hypothetical protein
MSTRPEAKNECAGEGQQEFNWPIDRPTTSQTVVETALF